MSELTKITNPSSSFTQSYQNILQTPQNSSNIDLFTPLKHQSSTTSKSRTLPSHLDASKKSDIPNPLYTFNRTQFLTKMPKNSCAFIACFDFLRGANWLSLINVWNHDLPYMVKSLLSRTPKDTDLSQVIPSIQDALKNYFNTSLQPREDPWVLIQSVRYKLQQYTEFQSMPLLKNTNCDKQCKGYITDITYDRSPMSKYCNIAQHYCDQCNKEGTPQVIRLPNQFYIRIKTPKIGVFDEVYLPNFENHKPKSYLQYSKKHDHFRSITFVKKQIIIRDGYNEQERNIQQLGSILNEDYWSTYAILFSSQAQDLMRKAIGGYRRCTPVRYITGTMFNGQDQPVQNNSELRNEVSNIQNDQRSNLNGFRQKNLFTGQHVRQLKTNPLAQKALQIAEKIRKACKSQYISTLREDMLFIDDVSPIFMNLLVQQNDKIDELQNKSHHLERRIINLQQQNMFLKTKVDEFEQTIVIILDSMNKLGAQGNYRQSPNKTQLKLYTPQPIGKQEQRQQIVERTEVEERLIIPQNQEINKKLDGFQSQAVKKEQLSLTQKKQKKKMKESYTQDDWISPQILLKTDRRKTFSIQGNQEEKIRNEALQDIPKDSCAWISAVDMLQKSKFLEIIRQPNEPYPELINSLTGKLGYSYAEAMKQVYKHCRNYSLQLFEQGLPEDPWLFLNYMEMMLNKQGTDIQKQPLYPICQCSCGLEGKKVVHGNLQLIRLPSSNRFEINPTNCPACRRNSCTLIKYLPEYFLVRLHDLKSKGLYSAPGLPFYKGYYADSYIQFNYQKNHFRCLKLIGPNKLKILDNGKVLDINDINRRKHEVEHSQWQNYIISFKKSDSAEKHHYQEQYPKPLTSFRRVHIGGMSDEKSRIRIIHWNIQSKIQILKKSKLIREVKPSIASIQESRKQITIKNYKSYHSVAATQANRRLKFNACVIVDEQINSELIYSGEDFVMVRCWQKPLKNEILAISIYLNQSLSQDSKIDRLQQLQLQIQHHLQRFPFSDLLILGDFNKTYQQLIELQGNCAFIDTLKSLQWHNYGVTVKPTHTHGIGRQIDHIFSSEKLLKTQKITNPGQSRSDHALLLAEIQSISIPDDGSLIPNKQFRMRLQQYIKDNSEVTNILDAIDAVKKQGVSMTKRINKSIRSKVQINYDNICRIKQQNWTQDYLNKYNEKIDQYMSTKNKSKVFPILKRLTGYDSFQKKDGSIMDKAIINDKLIYGKQLDQELIKHFQENHRSIKPIPDFEVDFPLDYIPEEQLIEAARRLKRGKAVSWDCIGSFIFDIDKECLKQKNRCSLCIRKVIMMRKLCTKQYWADPRSRIHYESRIIPLNKAHPHKPLLHQYRPIVIASWVFKFLEQIIMPQLKEYQTKQLSRYQFGFVPGVGIDECKRMLYKQAKKSLSRHIRNDKQRPKLIFFDVKSAYDSTDLEILYLKIKKKEILTEKNINLLKFIHSHMKVRLNDFECNLSRGVPQGLSSSPALFSIYVEQALEQLNKICMTLFFADDIVSLAKNNMEMDLCIRNTRLQLQKLSLTLNLKKSGIMPIYLRFMKLQRPKQYDGIPYTDKYKYLGTSLFNNLDPRRHFSEIQNHVNHIIIKLASIRIKGDLKTCLNLFKVLILPRMRMVCCYFDLVTDKQRQDIISFIRKTFKRFCCLPRTCSNEVVDAMLGDLSNCINRLTVIVQEKLLCHLTQRRFITANKYLIGNTSIGRPFKKIPKNLWLMLRMMYGRQCKQHRHVINSRHLKEEHGITVDLVNTINGIQQEPQSIRRFSKMLYKMITQLKTIIC